MLVFLLLAIFRLAWCWKQLRPIVVLNPDADVNFADLEIVVDTETLIATGNMEPDCRDVEFALDSKGENVLPHFLEGGCDSHMTRFWVTPDLVPSGGLSIYMFYGYSVLDEIGRSETTWVGKFYSMQDTPSCGPNWDNLTIATDRFPYGASLGGNLGGDPYHEHAASGLTNRSDNERRVLEDYFPITSQFHTHPFAGSSSNDPNLPPYSTVQFCESRYQELRTGAIGMFPNVSLAQYGPDWNLYGVMEDNFPLGRLGGAATQGGGLTHDHMMTFSTFEANETYLLYLDTSAPNVWGTLDDHLHPDAVLAVDSATLLPPYRYVVFGRFTGTIATSAAGMLSMATDVPPKGYVAVDWMEGYFPRGTSSEVLLKQTGGATNHTHMFDGTFGPTNRFVKCKVTSSIKMTEDTHTHNFKGDTDPEYHVPAYFSVKFISPKSSLVSVVGSPVFLCNGTAADDPTVCSNQIGECIAPNTCNCTVGYGGLWCELYACNGTSQKESTVCNGFGECLGIDTCLCRNDTSGDYCEEWNCSSISRTEDSVCSGQGRCESPGACICDPGYNGTDCEIFHCFEVRMDSVSVCSGNGNCTTPDMCVCEPGYNGSACENWWCSGIHHLNSSVCSGNGICSEPNDCLCDPGYYDFVADLCGYWDCYGIQMDEIDQVCSTYGTCVSPNSCLCENGYYSFDPVELDCRDWNCTGGHESVGCNMHGSCESPEICNCTEGYYGDNCEFWDCFNVPMYEQGACSGGDCLSPNECSCAQDQCTGIVSTCVFGISCAEVLFPGTWHASRRVKIPFIATFDVRSHPDLLVIVDEKRSDGQESSMVTQRAYFNCFSIVVDFEELFGSVDVNNSDVCSFETYGGIVLSLRIEGFSPQHNLKNGSIVELMLLEQVDYDSRDSRASVPLFRTWKEPPPLEESNEISIHVGAFVVMILVIGGLVLGLLLLLVLVIVCACRSRVQTKVADGVVELDTIQSPKGVPEKEKASANDEKSEKAVVSEPKEGSALAGEEGDSSEEEEQSSENESSSSSD